MIALFRKFFANLFGGPAPRRQARYTFDLTVTGQPELPGIDVPSHEEVLRVVLTRFPLTIVARQYNALPPELQRYFVRGKK